MKIALNIILKLRNDINLDFFGLYSFLKKLRIFLKVELFIIYKNEKTTNFNLKKNDNIDLR